MSSTHRGKFGAVKRAAFLTALREGSRRGAAAEAVGISRETVRLAYNADPDFAAQVEQAEMDANEPVEDALYQAALAGNVVAAQVWLYNRMPERWQDRRRVDATHSGPSGGPVEIRVVYDDVDRSA